MQTDAANSIQNDARGRARARLPGPRGEKGRKILWGWAGGLRTRPSPENPQIKRCFPGIMDATHLIVNRGREHMRSPQRWILWGGDLLVFLLFAALGRASHGLLNEGPMLWGVARAAAPFFISWMIVAWVARLDRMDPTRPLSHGALRTGLAWLGAGILGLSLRSLALGRPAPLPFAVITLVGNGLLLILWRGFWQIWIARKQRAMLAGK